MKTESFAVTRLTATKWIRTDLSEFHIGFHLTAERTVETTCNALPTATYRLSFRTDCATEAMEVSGTSDHVYGWQRLDTPGTVFHDLLAGAEADTILHALRDLCDFAEKGEFPVQTRRVLEGLLRGLTASKSRASA